MKLELWSLGKTSFDYLKEGIAIYEKRLGHFLPFQYVEIPDLKNTKKLSEQQIREKEGEQLLAKIESGDFLILLDERGKQYSSIQLSEMLNKRLQQSNKRLVFVIGGAYGFSEAVYKRANSKWGLSRLTFSHQMVRLFVIEQLYRGMSILKGLPYHHE